MHKVQTQPDVACVGKGSQRLTVAGCGNPYAGDDSVGPEIIRRLEARDDLKCQLRVLPEGGLGLLSLFEGADVVLFVDAVLGECSPGTIHLIPMPSQQVWPRALGLITSHGWGLGETFGLACALGRQVPRFMLLGVELGEVSLGARRSQAVDRAIELIVDRFQAIQALLMDSESPVWVSGHRFLPGDDSFPCR